MIIIKHTNELKPKELIEIFKQRVAVFVVEQNCPYQEVDTNDFGDLHVCLIENNTLKAYTRIIDKGNYITFGRVLVVKSYRKNGLGRQIVQATIDEIKKRFPTQPIQIQAQAYLQKFYESFGFKAISTIYLEDNIPHLDMLLETN
ncbi:GNAT family N-acetyltransferase [Companilactobacillus kimchii]|uniref:Acetyltransferase n=2 Tax=Companilactobacillus kimchii TaxID=2801452 RepID=A0ABR5NX11_9LACO|nr:GNAT family N-acetyltransferase [Companilactobacillus kimchii]KAE9559919.1 GCN5 family acetyltransferase [Companilactobacillus kimchii]KRK53431.1 acetyltransferase [Companilactobacillus kimchii DSM 13961 = JCM 10707]OWF33458.1 Protein ElaA [Companilactobacillus kimchii]GEO46538.1 acetyltransferase [Companilactobacillus paralimentarius]